MRVIAVLPYEILTGNGKHVRRAVKVIFEDGVQVPFMEMLSKRKAIEQAVEYRRRENERV